jgi:type I restriction enzyme M protein
MEACLLITRTNKTKNRKGKILFINAVNEVKQEKSIAFLEQQHIEKIFNAYKEFENSEGFAKVVDKQDVLAKGASLNVALYLSNVVHSTDKRNLHEVIEEWKESSSQLKKSMNELFSVIEGKNNG